MGILSKLKPHDDACGFWKIGLLYKSSPFCADRCRAGFALILHGQPHCTIFSTMPQLSHGRFDQEIQALLWQVAQLHPFPGAYHPQILHVHDLAESGDDAHKGIIKRMEELSEEDHKKWADDFASKFDSLEDA